jgi:hypothetical protein
MYNHSFANCTASWSGIDVKASLDSGMPISVTRTTAGNTFKPTGAGKIIKIKQTDESGLVTCTVDYSSPAYTLLMAQYLLETIAPFILYDGDTKRRWYYINSVIVTVPDLSMGIDTAPFSFQFFYEKADYQPGAASNLNLNIIGS